MDFEKNLQRNKFAEKLGFIFAYFFFTTTLYLILSFFNKIPVSWNYLHVMTITLIITLVGVVIKRFLK